VATLSTNSRQKKIIENEAQERFRKKGEQRQRALRSGAPEGDLTPAIVTTLSIEEKRGKKEIKAGFHRSSRGRGKKRKELHLDVAANYRSWGPRKSPPNDWA